MDIGYVVGVAGSIASLITLFVSAPSWKSRVVHAIYVLLVTVLSGAYVAHESQLAKYAALETQAQRLIATADFSNDGSTRGFILASLSFLEKHRQEFPDTYESAKKLAIGSGVLESKQNDGMERLYQGWRLQDIGNAMKALLTGLSGAGKS